MVCTKLTRNSKIICDHFKITHQVSASPPEIVLESQGNKRKKKDHFTDPYLLSRKILGLCLYFGNK